MTKQRLAVIVDDNRSFADVVSEMLRRLDYYPYVCTNYESAMDVLGKSPVALFLADIYMPGMGGIAGIQKMRAIFPTATIVAMSGGWDGMSAENTIAAAKKVGADACLEKPFTTQDLEAVIQSL